MKKSKIILLAHYTIKEGKKDEFMSLFASMAKYSASEPGNLCYRSYSSAGDEHDFFIYEEYADDDALNAHRNAPYFQEILIGEIIPLLDKRVVTFLNEHTF